LFNFDFNLDKYHLNPNYLRFFHFYSHLAIQILKYFKY